MEALIDFLKAHQVHNSNDWTHTSIKSPKGSYKINDNELNDFYKLYTTALEKNELFITERCPDITPLRVDIDLRIENKKNIKPAKHFYNKLHYTRLCQEIWKIIKNSIEIDNDKKYNFYLTEKEKPSIKSNGDIGDGFHLVLPEVCCSAKYQLYVRSKLINMGVIEDIFADIPHCNSIENIYDSGIIERNWTVYGSIGKMDGPLYKITKTYDVKNNIFEEYNLENNEEFEKMINYLSVRNKTDVDFNFSSENAKFDFEQWANNENIITKVDKQSKNIKSTKVAMSQTILDIDQIKELIGVLSTKRASNYEDWVRVCWCLRNIDDDLFEDFDLFSQKDDKKYDYNAVYRTWNSPNRNEDEGLQIGTLYYWAKVDNQEEYNKILDKDITKMIQNHPKTHIGIANIINKKYGTEFICVNPTGSVDKRIWYYFDGLIWRPKAYPILREHISRSIKFYFTAELNKLNNILDALEEEIDNIDSNKAKKEKQREKKKIEKTIKSVNDTLVSLGNSNFIDSVAKEAGFMMINTDFEDKVNKNPNLLAFNNGILDLNTMQLRDGIPSDLITVSTCLNYNPRPPHVADVNNFMAEILPVKSVRDYTLFYLASCLYGENDQQKLVVMTGEGGNGKSLLIKLIEQVMGEYVGTLDVAYVTQKRAHSSKPCPELLALRHKRIGIIQEPDKKDVLNMGIVKQLTGNDNVTARHMYGIDIVRFNNTAKLIMLCNDIPAPSSQDDGVWRRLRVVHFPMKFVDNPTEPNERKRDYMIEHKFKGWYEAFMKILLDKYKILVEEHNRKIPEPKEIMDFTNTYMEGNNDFLAFCRGMIVKDDAAVMSSKEIYDNLRLYYEAENLGRCPPKKEFMPFLKKTYGKAFTQANGLKGYKLKVEEEIVDEIDDDIVLMEEVDGED